MAAALGIPPRGYQRHRRSAALNHYDVPESLRLRAIELGAVAGDLARDGPTHPAVASRSALRQRDQILHDAVEGVVLGRVHGGHALAQQELGVVGRDDATDDDGGSAPGGPQPVEHVGHQLEVGARQDGQPHDVDVLVAGGRHDLRRGQPDPLVDHLEAGVTRRHGDLLGTVGVPVQPGLGHEEARRATRALREGLGAYAHRGQVLTAPSDAAADARRGPELPEHLAQGPGPLPGRATGMGQGDGGLHDVAVRALVGRHPAQLVEGGAHGLGVAAGASAPGPRSARPRRDGQPGGCSRSRRRPGAATGRSR